ncbi:MAG: PAS domain S-box protein [Dehalococcoidales bacterium]|nr:PAS domain S-box protein [Dehalococcoidales bacterium]
MTLKTGRNSEENNDSGVYLNVSQDSLSVVLNSVSDGIIFTDLDHIITAANTSLAEMCGFEQPGEIIGRDILDIIARADKPSIVNYLDTVKTTGNEAEIECNLVRANKNRFSTELKVELTRSSKGEPDGYVFIIKDTSELNLTEEDILMAERNFRKSLDDSQLGIVIVNQDEEVQYANEAVLEIFGLSTVDELRATPPSAFLTPESYTLFLQRVSDRKNGNPLPRTFEMSHYQKDGTIRHMTVFRRVVVWNGEICYQFSYHDITNLKETSELYKALTDYSPICVYIVQDGKFSYANRIFQTISGYSLEELMDMSPDEIVFPEDRNHVKKMAGRMLKDNTIPSYEYRFVDKNGNVRWAMESVNSIYINGKRAIVGNTSDITDQKFATQELNYSDAALRSINEGVYFMDDEFVITRWNTTCEQMFGIPASEAVGQHIWDFVELVEDYPGHNQVRMDNLLADRSNKDEQLYKARNGDIWLDVYIQGVELNGQISGWLSILSDITERKQMEKELKESEEYLRSVISSMDDLVFTYDLEGKFTNFYKASKPITEYIENTGMKFIDMHYREVLPTNVSDVMEPAFNEACETGENTQFEYNMAVAHTDDIRYFDARVSPMRDSDNKIVGVLIISRDITERVRAEKAAIESEQRMHSILNSMDDFFFTYDLDGRFRDFFKVTKPVEDNIKRLELQFQDEHYRNILPPAVTEAMEPAFNKACETGENTQFEYHLAIGEGQEEDWFDARVSPIRNAENIVSGMLIVSRDITERVRAEKALEESEQRIRSILNAMDDLIFTYDLDGRFLPFYKVSQYPEIESPDRGNFVGVTYRDFLPPEVSDKMDVAFEALLRSGENQQFDYCMLINGENRWFDARVSPIRDDDQTITGILVISREITERITVEYALAESEEKMRSLITSMDDIVFSFDLNGRFTHFYQPYHSHNLIVQADQFVGKNYHDVLPVDVSEKLEIAFDKLVTTGENQQFDYWIKPNDELLCYDAKISPVLDRYGKITGVTAVTRDITSRKEMEDKIVEASREWEATFDSMTESVYITDTDYRILKTNKAYADSVGMEIKDVIGKYCYKVSQNRNTPCPGCTIAEVNQTKSQVIHEAVDKTREKAFQIITSPIFDNDGNITSYITSTRDVSALKKIEVQLQQSQLLASLGTMTAGIAHEVNNPLGSVLLLSELLIKDGAPENIKKDLRVIHSEAKRAAKIMSTLLTYRNRSVTNIRRLNISRIIRKVMSIRQYRQNVLNINSILDIPDEPVYLLGDSSQLTQVLMNIIINAEEALKDVGPGIITVSLVQDNNWVRISVADNGCGIPEENLVSVFHPFFTTKKVGEGTGLGLSTCYSIITSHNGLIRVENNETGGATFIIELPVAAKTEKNDVTRKRGKKEYSSENSEGRSAER